MSEENTQSQGELVVDMKEMNLFSSVLGKKTCDVQGSNYTYNTRKASKVIEEQCKSNPCPSCHVLTAGLKLNKNARLRTLDGTRTFLNTYETMMVTVDEMERSRPAAAANMRNDWREKLKELFIHFIIPVLYKFPFSGVTPSLDIFNIFCVEVMLVFHLGISRMMKDSACKRLRCSNIWKDS